MTAEALESEFSSRGEVRGGALRLPADAALDLVRRARAARIPVLGVEGYADAGAAAPDPMHVLDFGGAGCRTNPWAEAEAFLDERADAGLWLAVALGDPAPR